MKQKKMFTLLSVLALSTALFTACGSNNGTNNTSGGENAKPSQNAVAEKPYTVDLLMVGDGKEEDVQAVEDEISKITKPLINADVNITRVGFGSFQQQANLSLSSGEKMDLFVTFALDISSLSSSGQILPMTKLLEGHGQDILKNLSEGDRRAVSINNEIYAIPTAKEKATNYGYIMLKEIADEVGFKPEEVKTYDQLEAIMTKAKKLHPEMYPIGLDFTNVYRPGTEDNLGTGSGVIDGLGESTKVVNMIETDSYKDFVNHMYKWSTSGLVMPDAANNSESRISLLKAGKVMGGFSGLNPGNVDDIAKQVGKPFTVIELTKPFSITGHVSGMGWSLASSSENPEKAIEFLNLVHTNADISNLLVYGVKDRNYVMVDEAKGIIDYPQGVDGGNTGWMSLPWATPNASIAYIWKGEPEDKWDYLQQYNSSAHQSPAKGFRFNAESVANEITMVSNVDAKFALALESGTLDPEKTLPKYLEELKAAGVDKIIAEKQKQLDAWLAANK
ncbi:ABC transporter substrate-binding protein [Paenibacillus lignilyticus]|uniref:ABC transporter substrate-binding protein n=1 Tax=Paenibacillus lignilyticus TaxID=1172615 RepID=A0ABS5CCK3_9BACL|nr:ABC transporter substrate-binding protein [Paenibacillus lignilyticus]MBP3961599.1 ABC transporter substrate-binding protein [Paenibacillus lignilyticus]MBP3963731.1 ABC transporter substrate-binding protein [Paenibacillus lignilyticus]